MQAYFHQQSTRPDTVGLALHDSPVGIASWLVEKYRMWSDCAADVESVWSKDDLLDHVALYHLTGTITSSMRRMEASADRHAAVTAAPSVTSNE